jgi:hypothetical protein
MPQHHYDLLVIPAYEYSYFRQTKLYGSIKQWELINSPFIVLIQEIDK